MALSVPFRVIDINLVGVRCVAPRIADKFSNGSKVITSEAILTGKAISVIKEYQAAVSVSTG